MMTADDDNKGRELNELNDSEFNLDDPDSLPWLETGGDYEEDGTSPLKLALMVLGGLLLLSLVVGAIYWLQGRSDRAGGNGDLIAAQQGPYKVRPEDPEGKKFEGEGDAAFAASEGRGTDPARVAASNLPPAPVAVTTPAMANGGALVQLGAYGSSDQAEMGWAELSKRYSVLSGFAHRVTQATVEGRTVFRLNAVAASVSVADSLCGGVKSAGGNCIVVK